MLQLHLHLGRHLIVECTHRFEEVVESEDLRDHDEHAGDLRHRGRGLFQHPVDVGQSTTVDEPVDELRRRNLPVQRMFGDELSVLLLQGLREVGDEFTAHPRLVRHGAVEDLIGGVHLHIRQQHGEFRRHVVAELTLGQFVGIGQEFDRPVEVGVLLQVVQHPAVGARHRFGLGPSFAEDDVLRVVVRQHTVSDLVGERVQNLFPLLGGEGALMHERAQEQFDVDLVVGAVDAGRVVDGIGIDLDAAQCSFDTSQLSHTEVAALADHSRPHIGAVDADGVVGLVADIGVALGRGLDVGADSAVVDEVDGGLEDFGHEVGRAAFAGFDSEHRGGLCAEVDRLRRPGEDSAAGGDEFPVVVLPARARQVEESLTFDEAARGVGVRVEEDVPVVKGGDQADVLAAQHAVAEDVAAHIADAHDREVLGSGVESELAEVAFDGLPRTSGGDGHRLVVVADRSARSEGVAEPEAAALGDRIGHIGEPCRALVSGDDEIVVVAVVTDYAVGVDDDAGVIGAVGEVVGDFEHAFDEHLVGGLTGGHPGVPIAHRRQLLGEEPALCAGGHDEGVLDHLRLDEAEDLGTEVIATIRPAESAACDGAEAQVHAFDLRGVHPHLECRLRLRHEAELVGSDLEHECRGQRTGFVDVVVRAQRRPQQFERGPQHTVRVEARDLAECGFDGLIDLGHRRFASGVVDVRIELGGEVVDEQLRDLRVVAVDLTDIGVGIGEACLAQVFAQGADDRHMLPGEASDDEAVEDSRFLLAVPAGHEGLGDAVVVVIAQLFGEAESEVVDVPMRSVGEVECVGTFVDDVGTECREVGQDLGQADPVAAVEDETDGGVGALVGTVEPDSRTVARLEGFEPTDVGDRLGGGVVLAIAGRERLRPQVGPGL